MVTSKKSVNGTGTMDDPYQITKLAELQWIGTDATTLSKNYILMNNLNFADTEDNGMVDELYDSGGNKKMETGQL